jgi:hypothetical protein
VVEQRFRKPRVVGSSPIAGSSFRINRLGKPLAEPLRINSLNGLGFLTAKQVVVPVIGYTSAAMTGTASALTREVSRYTNKAALF